MKINPVYTYIQNTKICGNKKAAPDFQHQIKAKYSPSFGFGFSAFINGPSPADTENNILDKVHLKQALNFRINGVIEGNREENSNYQSTKNLYKFGRQIRDDLWKINCKDGITTAEVVSSLKQVIDEKPKSIKGYKGIKDTSDYHKQNDIKIRREFAKVLLRKISKINPKEGLFEGIKNKYKDTYKFFDDIAEEIYKKHKKEYLKYTASIKEGIIYGENEEVPKYNVSEEFEKLPPETQKRATEKWGDDINEMCLNYLADRGSADAVNRTAKPEFDTAILQTLPRYFSPLTDTKKACDFDIEPLYRWLRIDNPDEFLKDFEIGEEYSYPVSQSCSKSCTCAEHVHFTDLNKNLNVKLRIHPKGSITKAYDFKSIDCNRNFIYDDIEPRYRKNEAIYPANAKFKVLGIFEDYLNSNAQNIGCGLETEDNYKIIIDLQEM